MGFGSAPAGGSPAGLDLPTTTEARVASTPAALELDGLTKDFKLDARGRYVEAHPIDTKVFHRLRIATASMRSAPGTGNGVGNQSHIDQQKIEAQVRDQVALTVADMIDAREIEDRGIELDLGTRGRVNYVYNYFNLHTGRPGSFRSDSATPP